MDYITEDRCRNIVREELNSKYVLTAVCDVKHEEVNNMKDSMERMENRFFKMWLTVVGTLLTAFATLVAVLVK